MKKPFRLRKLPLEELLEILTELYESGVDYIDIAGTVSEDKEFPQDVIKITVKPDYINKDLDDLDDLEDLERSNDNITINIKLSDTDINDLI